MMPKMRCSQRSAIISLACGVSRNEKCRCQQRNEIASRQESMRDTSVALCISLKEHRSGLTGRSSIDQSAEGRAGKFLQQEKDYSYENTFRQSARVAPRSLCGPDVPV